jgi:hypothetical protein
MVSMSLLVNGLLRVHGQLLFNEGQALLLLLFYLFALLRLLLLGFITFLHPTVVSLHTFRAVVTRFIFIGVISNVVEEVGSWVRFWLLKLSC